MATASSEREMSSHPVGKPKGLSSLEPPSRIRPNSRMVRPALRLRWQRHKNRYGAPRGTGSCGPNDFVCFQYFPEIVLECFDIVPGCSRCCFSCHSARGLPSLQAIACKFQLYQYWTGVSLIIVNQYRSNISTCIYVYIYIYPH